MLRLSEEFLSQYKGKQPRWGFDGLGYIVYLRTYARTKQDGTLEDWWETVRRFTEGNFNIEVQRLKAIGKWSVEREQLLIQEMERFYHLAFNLVILPPGRGIWMSGTEYEKRSGDALNNCWLVTMKPQPYEKGGTSTVSFPACFTFDQAMKGGGVGVNIQKKNTDQMPPVRNKVILAFTCDPLHPDYESELKPLGVAEQRDHVFPVIIIKDSREGWVAALSQVIDAHFDPVLPITNDGAIRLFLNVSNIRPKGEPIKGFGGVASGPAPLVRLLQQVNEILNRRVGEQLTPTEWGDIIQLIGTCVVAGNVRRTALILIGDRDDYQFINSKNYDLEENKETSQWRWASNNSVDIDITTTLQEFRSIAENIYRNGEPGIANISLARNYGRICDGYQEGIDGEVEGFNPCGEISLPNGSPCNLFEINLPRIHELIVRGIETEKLYEEAAYLAARYAYRVTFRPYEWAVTRDVVQRHRRIGVGITGFTDWVLLRFGQKAVLGFDKEGDPIYNLEVRKALDELYRHVKETNTAHAKDLKANPSIKLTTVKPSGTVSILMGVSPGQHFHWSPYMIRRVRMAANAPLVPVLKDCGYPIEYAINGFDKQGNPVYDTGTVVVSFPVKAPTAEHPNFQSARDVSLEEQAAIQALLQTYWADNSVSSTLTFKKPKPKPVFFADGIQLLDRFGKPKLEINPKEEEAVIDQIARILYQYRDVFKSTTMLPYAADTYPQMPYEAVTKKQYEEMASQIKYKPWELLNSGVVAEGMDDSEDIVGECEGGSCPIK